MKTFAYLTHPHEEEEVFNSSITKYMPSFLKHRMIDFLPVYTYGEVIYAQGMANKGQEKMIKGIIMHCPFCKRAGMSENRIVDKIEKGLKEAVENGASLAGMDQCVSAICRGGAKLKNDVKIPITNGKSFALYKHIRLIKEAAQLLGLNWPQAKILIMGENEKQIAVVAKILAAENKYLTLAGNQLCFQEKLAAMLMYEMGLALKVSDKLQESLKKAEVVINIGVNLKDILGCCRAGAIVFDLSAPFLKSIEGGRDDVLYLDGGTIEIPAEFNCSKRSPNIPKFMEESSLAETILLLLEENYVGFSIGDEVSVEQVKEIGRMASKYKWETVNWRCKGKYLSREDILRFREKWSIKKKS